MSISQRLSPEITGSGKPRDRMEKRNVEKGWGVVFDCDEGRHKGLTPDQAGERLDDPSVPLARERALLNLCQIGRAHV